MEESEKQTVAQEATTGESAPAYWLGITEHQMRESVLALVAEMEKLPPGLLGNLPAIAHDLLRVLDDFTKLTKRGFKMVPPGPPSPPVAEEAKEDPMEARITKLEAAVDHIKGDVAEIKGHLQKIRDDITSIRTTDFRLTFGAIIFVALGLAGIMAKGFHWF